MFPLAAGISGGLNLLGGFLQQGNQEDMLQQQEAFSAQQAKQAEDFSASQAAIQRDWEGTMSNTAYQRGVEDMKRAGINPILAAGGGGASTPGVSAPSGVAGSTPGAPQLQNVIGNAGAAALQGAQVNAQLDKIGSETDNIDANTALQHKQYRTEVARGGLVDAQTAVQKGILGSMQADIAKSRTLADFFNSDTGKILIKTGAAGGLVNSAIAPVINGVGAVVGARSASSANALRSITGSNISRRFEEDFGTPLTSAP